MRKGIGPRGLGAPKSAAKMYGDSPAKKASEYGRRHDRLVQRSDKKMQAGLEEQYGRDTFTGREIGAAKGKKIDKAHKLSEKAAKIRTKKNK